MLPAIPGRRAFSTCSSTTWPCSRTAPQVSSPTSLRTNVERMELVGRAHGALKEGARLFAKWVAGIARKRFEDVASDQLLQGGSHLWPQSEHGVRAQARGVRAR